jgi:hypothetical protein
MKRSAVRAGSGALLLVAGLAAMGGLIAVLYSDIPDADAWRLRLGLAGALITSALAQLAILVGVWLIRHASRDEP